MSFFDELTEAELHYADSLLTQVDLREGYELCREGSFGAEAFLIVEGFAIVTRGGKHIASVGPGDLVGELALLGDHLRTATVTATTDLSAYVMHTGEFEALLALPGVGDKVHNLAASRR